MLPNIIWYQIFRIPGPRLFLVLSFSDIDSMLYRYTDYIYGYFKLKMHQYLSLGASTWTKFTEFSENFQTASDPPPPTLFSEKNVALLSGKSVPVVLSLYRKSAT